MNPLDWYDPTSQIVGWSGIIASALQYSGWTIGDNGVLYTSGWGGGSRGLITTFKIGPYAEIAGTGLGVLSVGVDTYGVITGSITGPHWWANTAMTGAGTFGGPLGAGLAGGYFLTDTFYPHQNEAEGGFVQLIRDGPIINNEINNQMNAAAGNPGSF
jgi:hypothetical protein